MSTSVQEQPMDLDLNQSPSSGSESPTGLITEIPPWLNELETAHERIEERIRQLEAIVSRIRERETTTTTTTTTTQVPAQAMVPPNEHRGSRERLVENGDHKTCLIAKALNMERPNSVPVGYFDCNICLEKAEDPILTCCGHLFCWGCFYQLPLIYLNIKECPVCDGEVTDTEVIPLYGNGDDIDSSKPKLEDCGVHLPPRPIAKRVESIRQKIINMGTIEHIRRTIDSIGLQALTQGHEFGLTNIITNGGDNGGQHRRPLLPPFASSPGLVVDTSEMPPFDDDAFDVDSFVDTPSLISYRRRSSRIAETAPSPAVRASLQRDRSINASFRLGTAGSSSPRDFAVPGSYTATRSQTVNRNEVVASVTSSSSSRRRTEDVNNGPRTRSRRRLR